MRSAFALRINSGSVIIICISANPAELVRAKPLHLLTQTALPLKSPTGAFIAAQTRSWLKYFFTGRVAETTCICCLKMSFYHYDPSVKRAFGALRRVRQTRNIKIIFQLKMRKANAARIPNHSPPSCNFGAKGVEYSHNQIQGSS